MKTLTQLELLKAIRKAALPQNRIERPVKGAGYRRRQKHRKEFLEAEQS